MNCHNLGHPNDGARERIKTSYAIDLYLLLGMNIQEGGVYQIFS